MKKYISLLFAALCMAAWTGCKKYEIEPQIKDPAYIRVFNNLVPTLDILHAQQVTPFLTFLMDPKTDATGVPADAAIIGDFLGTRKPFALSYAATEGNNSVGNSTIGGSLPTPGPPNLTPINYEYPGNAHVLAAPVINGFDLSAWAQVSSGKHRIMCVVRPQNGIKFKDLSPGIRGTILVDTTIDFEKGEVYTMEVLARDPDNGKYGLYVRKEQFIHQAFEADKIYTGFVNLSGLSTQEIRSGYVSSLPDKIQVNCTYLRYNDAASGGGNFYYTPVPGYDNVYFTSLSTKMDTTISFLPLPMLAQSDFFYQGLLRNYANVVAPSPVPGSMPYVRFAFLNADEPIYSNGFVLSCAADPAIINNYNPSNYTANLNLAVSNNGNYHVYPTLNIIEIVYGRVYLQQVARAFEQVP